MIKNQRDVAKIISPSLGVSEKEVIQVLSLLMQSTKEVLEGIESNEVYIYNLGSFTTKRKKIYDLIKYYEVRRAKLLEKEFNPETKAALIADCDFKLERLKQRNLDYREKDAARKAFKQNQHEQEDIDGSIQES